MKEEKFTYESPALEEAKFGQFIAGNSYGDPLPDEDEDE